MAFRFFTPQDVSLTLYQGSTNIFVFTIEDEDGPVDLSEWIGAAPASQFRTGFVRDAGAVTNCPQPTMSHLNGGLGGEIQLEIPYTQFESTSLVLSGRYSIEIIHSSGKRCEVVRGSWSVEKETTASYA